MARAFASFVRASFSTDGLIYLTFNVSYIDPDPERLLVVQDQEVEAIVDSIDSPSEMRTKITAAIVTKGSELEFTINDEEVTQPQWTKG